MFSQSKCLARAFTRKMSLMSDPLHPSRISKSQTASSFAKPKLLSFDLWNTLFTPRAPIYQQYYEVSHGEFGINKSRESIAEEFPEVFAEMESQFPNYGKYSEEISSHQEWWSELIMRLYNIPRNDSESEKLCQRLIERFSSSEAYRLFDDVIPVLEQLEANHVRFIGASTSDHRVFSIMDSLGIAKFFPKESVFLSYDMGVTKPSRDFYRPIAEKYYSIDKHELGTESGDMTSFLENSWHVGDSYEKDFVGAVRAGWNGVLLDRGKQSLFFQAKQEKAITNDCFEGQSVETLNGDDTVMISNNRVCISNLYELLRIFSIKPKG